MSSADAQACCNSVLLNIIISNIAVSEYELPLTVSYRLFAVLYCKFIIGRIIIIICEIKRLSCINIHLRIHRLPNQLTSCAFPKPHGKTVYNDVLLPYGVNLPLPHWHRHTRCVRKNIPIFCTRFLSYLGLYVKPARARSYQMSHFKAKMHHIRFPLGLCSRPTRGA